MKAGLVFRGGLVFLAGLLPAATPDVSDRYYEAIRNNDASAVRALVKAGDINVRDKRGSTPLMIAAAYGSIDSMRMLIGAGADVNAKNSFDATALMWCTGEIGKVRLLLEKGANVNAKSKQGRTPLMIAAAADGSFEVVSFLIDHGADVNARDGIQGSALLDAAFGNDTATIKLLLDKGADANQKNAAKLTPLMAAAGNGNIEAVRMLLAKGADVNAVSSPESKRVKNGPIGLGLFTPLLLAAASAGPETVKVLLDAGAHVNVQDVRGMTPLVLAIATDRPSAATVKLLLAKGADPSIRSKDGEAAVDWAKKYQYGPVLEALGIGQADRSAPGAITTATAVKPVSSRAAVEKSLDLLSRTSAGFFKEGGCVSCHSQNLTGMTIKAARENGFQVDEAADAEALRGARLGWSSFEQMLLQRMDPPGGADMLNYTLFQMAAGGSEPDRTTDAMVHDLAAMQRAGGNWDGPGIARPPMEDGNFGRTAMAIRALQVYAPAGRGPEFNDRIGRAAGWLMKAIPRTTEDRSMQVLGLKWAKADPPQMERLLADLMAIQRSDGGWAQTPELASDAYATGQVLYTLHEAGVPATGSAYRRGVEYLVRTQRADGSWHVQSRALKFQPYFQSGFPHDHDQWISAAATAWATIGLAYAAPEKLLAMAH